MPESNPLAPAEALVRRLAAARRQVSMAPRPGAPELKALQGLTPKGQSQGLMANVLVGASSLLVECGNVYSFGDDVVAELWEEGGPRLGVIAEGRKPTRIARGLISKMIICQAPAGKKGAFVQFPPPASFLATFLACDHLRDALPRIRRYAARPIFAPDFTLLGPGWHPEHSALVHGPAVEPIRRERPDLAAAPLDRLPPRLRGLLGGFCFRSPADLANALAALVTGLLADRFIEQPKPMILLDGNQPGVGKTLLARILGILLDGVEPRLVHFSADDEELAKRICANLREHASSLVAIDNAKVRAGDAISSPALEANAMAPTISLRILGRSATVTRENNLIWLVTMNDVKASPDLVSRGLPIRLYFEGDPRDRSFAGDPVAFAREHRVELLGELIGLVLDWVEAGCPEAELGHRCSRWGRIVGGILHHAGFPEVLTNLDEAAADFDTTFDELAALAEAALGSGDPAMVWHLVDPSPADAQDGEATRPENLGTPAGAWEPICRAAGVLAEALDPSKPARSRFTRIGGFLARHLNRPTPIEHGGRHGTARLIALEGRQRRYAFAIRWDAAEELDEAASAAAPDPLSEAIGDAGYTRPSPRPDPAHLPPDESVEPPAAVDPGGEGNGENWT